MLDVFCELEGGVASRIVSCCEKSLSREVLRD